MLTVPVLKTIEGMTVFRDDLRWNLLYLVPAYPRIRLDENGKPVFLLAKYALSDEDREQNPDLPDGGGYMNFDIVFAISDDEMATARREMQTWVDEEWNRLRNGTAAERALPGVAGTTEPPPVEFGAPTYSGGTVTMFAPQAEELVGARVAAGEPDLLAGNIAVFSMDLTPAGATFMERTLVGETTTDLTPVQVKYDLKMWARLPPVEIHVVADSEQLYNQTRKYMDGAGVDHCTTYDFQNTDINTETAEMSGLITVKIDPGSASVSPEVMEELRGYALELMQQMVENTFFTDNPEEGFFGDYPDGLPPDVLRDEQRQQSNSGNSKKYLREVHNSSTMHTELHLTQSSVVEWLIHPQATLETFFTGMSAAEIKQHVRVIDLEDSFFNELGLEVRVFAAFEDTALDAVEVEVKYEGRDENGELQRKTQTFTFDSNAPQTWSPSLIGNAREYEFRYRVKFAGRDFSAPTTWQRSTSRDLNISVPDVGRLVVKVQAGDLDFANMLRNAQITIAYQDLDANISREEQTISLSAKETEGQYERMIFDVVRQPVEYKRRFVLQTGDTIEDTQWQKTDSRQLLINQPFESIMQVRLVPAGDGWGEVVQVLVDLEYPDPGSVETSMTLALKSLQDFRTWEFFLRDREKRDFRYRVHASYKNGDFESTAFQHATGPITLPIQVRMPAETTIRIVPERLNLATAPVTEVHLTHPASGQQQTLVFQNKTVQEWRVPVKPGQPVSYTARVTHFPAVGEPVELPPITESDTFLILSPYQPPEPGELVVRLMASLVDFNATPLVTADLVYDDEVNRVRHTGSLAFDTSTRAGEWKVQVKDVNRKIYGYTLTYFVAPDNQPHVTDTQFQEKGLLVIPKYQPA